MALPADWTPAEELFALGAELGLNRERVQAELARFRDHHTAKGSVMKDWDAAARTWIRKVPEYSRGGGAQRQPAASAQRPAGPGQRSWTIGEEV